MSIAVRCPHCGKTAQVRDELAGKKARCVCGQIVTIPNQIPNAANLLGDELLMAEATLPGDQTAPTASPGIFFRKSRKRPVIPYAVVAGIATATFIIGLLTGMMLNGNNIPASGTPVSAVSSATASPTSSAIISNPAMPPPAPTAIPRGTPIGRQSYPVAKINWRMPLPLPIGFEEMMKSPPWTDIRPFGKGYATPEDAFEALRQAEQNVDFAAIVDSLCAETICIQYIQAGGQLNVLPPEIRREIGEKYNRQMTLPKTQQDISQVLYDAVPEKRSMILDMMDAVRKTRRENYFFAKGFANARIVDISDEQNRTRVTYDYLESGQSHRSIMYFKQAGGRWFLYLPQTGAR